MRINTAYLVLTLLVASCNISRYPIDETPKEAIDARLLGSWKEHKKNDNTIYRIKRESDRKYAISLIIDRKAEHYQGYLSRVCDNSFLNVMPVDTTGDKYCMLVRILNIGKGGTQLTVTGVADTNLQYLNGSAEVRQYVEKHCNERSFYGDTTVLYKVGLHSTK